MPKPNRYENFQNSIQSTSTSQGVAQALSTESTPLHFDDTPQLTSFIQPTARSIPSGQDAANSILSDHTTTQQVPSVRAASQYPSSRKRNGRVSMQHWTVNAIDFFKETCKRNDEIRKKQIVSHIGGSKLNSRRRAEMMAGIGQKPGRGQLYLATHRNEDGSFVNEAAKEICPSDAAS